MQSLYDWERNYVEPHATEHLSREDCRHIVQEASRLAGIKVPKIRFTKSAYMPCRAIPKDWELLIADWGRTRVTVLHELAHLATLQDIALGEDPHGPAFLATAIALYSKFLGLDVASLTASASSCGLVVGRSRIGSRRPPISRFENVEF